MKEADGLLEHVCFNELYSHLELCEMAGSPANRRIMQAGLNGE